MANLQERRDKNGKLISYKIRVHRGRGADGRQLTPWQTTFKVEPTWTEKSARRKAEAFAAVFEKECIEGTKTVSRQKFAEFCQYVLNLKEQRGAKHSTITRYKELTQRIYPAIGHLKLTDIRVDHLNDLYTQLSKSGIRKGSGKATAKATLAEIVKEKALSRSKIASLAGLSASTVADALNGKPVSLHTAEAITKALEITLERAFSVQEDNRPLSSKTILEHHRLISTVLEQALKESLIPFNPASRADLPKAERKEVAYFQPAQIAAIRDALDLEPIKWKTLIHLFLITGARRGEVLGLKWSRVDFDKNRVHICNNILYSVERGIYEDTPKTSESTRFVSLPAETMHLLRQYRAWQSTERLRLGEYFQDQGFVFSQDNGKPMHPDSVTDWLKKFSKRHDLPHIHPHSFRHTMASMLYFNGVDSVSISKRLGHAQVSTTANVYAHIIEEADQKNADILADVFLKKA